MSEFEKLVGRLDLCLYEKQIHSHGGGKWYSRNSCKYLSAEEVSDEIMQDVYFLAKSGDVLSERIAELEARNASLTADLAASRRREEAAVSALRQVQHDIDGAECRDDLDGIKGYIDTEIIAKMCGPCAENEKEESPCTKT